MLISLMFINLLAFNFLETNAKCSDVNNFDYIVVGSGSSGAVVAARLAEDKNIKVLLLEAGGEPSKNSTIPLISYKAYGTEVDWNYQTVKQEKCCDLYANKVLNIFRGKMLGGSSSINAMVYTRGHKRDFDNWKKMGNAGWGYEDVLPYFLKLEDYQIPTTPETAASHHQGGPITVSLPSFKSPMADAFLEGGKELGYKTIDYNTNESIGFMYMPSNIRKGVRCSTYVGYLKPAMKANKNLKVLTFAVATKLIINRSKTVTGVEYETDGATCIAKAKYEVILSAGVFESPKLLMLSGIGPKEELKKHNIIVVKHLPGVGQNLQDHISLAGMTSLVEGNVTCNTHRYDTKKYLVEWEQNRTGPMTVPIAAEGVAFTQTKYAKNEENWPDMEIYMVSDTLTKLAKKLLIPLYTAFLPNEKQDGVSFLVVLIRPKSRGTVTLRTKNPHAKPLIDPKYLSNKNDVNVLVEGFKFAKRLLGTKLFKHYKAKLLFGGLIPQCILPLLFGGYNNYLKCYVRKTASTSFHHSSTCLMGPKNNKMAVVDNQLRVYGIKHLRIADASIMPQLLGVHLNAPCMMIGEKAADMIKKSRKRS